MKAGSYIVVHIAHAVIYYSVQPPFKNKATKTVWVPFQDNIAIL
jgi:hypothetical protein